MSKFEFWALNALWALNLQCPKFRASSSVAIFLDHHGFPGRDLQSTIPGDYYFNGLRLTGAASHFRFAIFLPNLPGCITKKSPGCITLAGALKIFF